MLLVSSFGKNNIVLQKLHFDVVYDEIIPYVKVIGKEFDVNRDGVTYQFNIKNDAQDVLARWLYGLTYAHAIKLLSLKSKGDFRHAAETPNCHTGVREITRVMDLPFDATMLKTDAGQTLAFEDLRRGIISKASELPMPPDLMDPY